MAGQAVSRARRERALARVGAIGLEAAAAEVGVSEETLSRWAAKAGAEVVEAEPAPGHGAAAIEAEPEMPEGDALEALRENVRRLQRSMERARQASDRMIDAGRAADARNTAIAAGIWCDKFRQMTQVAIEAEEHRVRLTRSQGEVLAGLLRLFLGALDLPMGPAVRELLREMLMAAGSGSPIAVSPALAEAARRELFGEVERPPALPASVDVAGTVVEGEESSGAFGSDDDDQEADVVASTVRPSTARSGGALA